MEYGTTMNLMATKANNIDYSVKQYSVQGLSFELHWSQVEKLVGLFVLRRINPFWVI